MKILDLKKEEKEDLKSLLKKIILKKEIEFDWLDLSNRYNKINDLNENEEEFLEISCYNDYLNSDCIYETNIYINDNQLFIEHKGKKYIFDDSDTIKEALLSIEDALDFVIKHEDEKSNTIKQFFG
ncbi:hypothetical protein [Streptobacillus canis]|uniref:hypothetical protein n=1 Tax=Streptobacillus canis TaxID=2678686 RepID=UPI0012E13C83|nr:hypothetical protein [Streptobacillus canis]